MKRRDVLSTAVLAAAGAACGAPGVGVAPGAGGKPTVATSTSVLADLVRQVAGDRAAVVGVVPVGQNPYGYEATPQDAVALSRATVFFANGLHYDDFVTRLVENARSPSLRVVTLSDGLTTLRSEIDHGDHTHLFPNPNLYLDPRNAAAYVEKIRDALARADERNAGAYQASAGRYLAELEALDAWIRAEVERLPPGKRKLMKDHDSLIYFAYRYGLESWAASYEGTQEAGPTASQYAALVTQVKRNGIAVVFGEEGFSPKLMQQLAQDTGARFVPGLYAVTLGPPPETDSYVELMRHNTRLIVESLR